MLSSLETAPGTIGTTIVAALMEHNWGAKLWTQAAVFTDAQHVAFAWRALGGVLGIGASLNSLPRGLASQP